MENPRLLSHARPTPLDRFYFGVCYYPEHCGEEAWPRDAGRMAEAGINLARLAEFAWTLMEPVEGQYDFSLFDRAIAQLAEHGIGTMLCTPTATPPRWLTLRHPDMLREDSTGRAMSHGSRQHASNMHPGYHEHSVRITRAMAEHFRDNPHVIGWQTDNEFNCHFSEDHSPAAQQQFIEWCRQRYGANIDQLNQAWGTSFWSQTYGNFEELVTPRRESPCYLNPAHVLDYHRFLSDGATGFQRGQIEVLRSVNPKWWITHNGTFDHIDYRGPFTKDLDFLSFDSYPMFKADPKDRPAWDACRLDRTRGWSGNFFVPEQQMGAGGQTTYMHDSPAPGESRQFAWRSVARGADGLMFFRWRTCRFGAEQYWQGILDHDDVPRRRYAEAKQLGNEFAKIGQELLSSTVRTDVAIAGPDSDVNEAFEACHMGLPLPSKVSVDVHRYLFDRGYATGFVHPEDDLSDVKLYVIPHWASFDPAWVEPIRRWVQAGGVLLIGAMSGTRDMNNNIVSETPPGALGELAGVRVADYTRVNEPRVRPMELAIKGQDETVAGEHWCEQLELSEGVEVLAQWRQQWFDGEPAITRKATGQGAVVYAGTWLTPDVISALLPSLLQQAKVTPLVEDMPQHVEAVQRFDKNKRLTFIFNHGQDSVTLNNPPLGQDLITEQPVSPGFKLPAFGVAVIKSTSP